MNRGVTFTRETAQLIADTVARVAEMPLGAVARRHKIRGIRPATQTRLGRIVTEGPIDPSNGLPRSDYTDARYWIQRVVQAPDRTDATLPSAWVQDEGTDAVTAIYPQEIGIPGYADGNHVLLNVPANIDAAHHWDADKLYVDLYESANGLRWISPRFGAWVDFTVPVWCTDENDCPPHEWGRVPGSPYIDTNNPVVGGCS